MKKLNHNKNILEVLQSRLDKKYGKGIIKAAKVLLLFGCISLFTSCVSDNNSGNNPSPIEGQNQTRTNNSAKTAPATITIESTGQTANLDDELYDTDEPHVIDAYFAEKVEGKNEYKKISRSRLGKSVYVIVDTINLKEKPINISIYEKENIIKGPIYFIQHQEVDGGFSDDKFVDSSNGVFTSNVRVKENKEFENNCAIFKLKLTNNNEGNLSEWKKNILNQKGHEINLCIKVETPENKNTIFCGANTEDDTEDNLWLNQEKKWFKLQYEIYYDYFIKDDLLHGPNIIYKHTKSVVRGNKNMRPIEAIILHRTSGSSLEGAIQRSIGTHFFVNNTNSGQIFQPVLLNKAVNHILEKKSARIAMFNLLNDNTIGIEVVGLAYVKKDHKLYSVYDLNKSLDEKEIPLSKAYIDRNNNTYYWKALTKEQTEATACIVQVLLEYYSLTLKDIYAHEELQPKTAGEGGAVKDAIWNYIIYWNKTN